MQRLLSSFIVILFLLASTREATAETLQIGELVILIPDEFELAHQFEGPGSKNFEFIPKDDAIEAWNEMISIQVGGQRDARVVVDNIAKGFLARCPTLQSMAGDAAGLPLSATDTMIIIVCEEMNVAGLPEPIHIREKQFVAIRSLQSESLSYVMQYAWHHDELTAKTPFDLESRYQTGIHDALINAFLAPFQPRN